MTDHEQPVKLVNEHEEARGHPETDYEVFCTESQLWWFRDYDLPLCEEPSHEHSVRELHRHWHRSVLALPDGTEVVPVSFHPSDPYAREQPPDYGLYLDPRWQPPWPHDHFDWPDFGVPNDLALARDALVSVLGRSRAGERVELGCVGGHGRTGTALSCLAALVGLPPSETVSWVRANYCPRAVETPAQEAFPLRFAVGAKPDEQDA